MTMTRPAPGGLSDEEVLRARIAQKKRYPSSGEAHDALTRLIERLRVAEEERAEAVARFDSINWSSRNWTTALKEAKAERDAARTAAEKYRKALQGIAESEQLFTENGDHHRNRLRGWAAEALRDHTKERE